MTRFHAASASAEDRAESYAAYCRDIEAYLCRKNDGHLIRIVGPSFEKVCGWAKQGVPIKVAFRGIDRYFDRYYAKGPRRRPVRVEFCEADVLDVFDQWRRAVGIGPAVPAADSGQSGDDPELGNGLAGEEALPADRRRQSLPSHLERAVARLTALRSGSDRSLDALVESIVRELDAARGTAKNLRGASRAGLLERLAALDAQLMVAARERLTAEARAELRGEAEAELAPFRRRMPPGAYEQSLTACMDRLLREKARLPVLTLE